MSETTSAKPGMKRSFATVIFLVLAVTLAIGYSLFQRAAARKTAAENAQLSAALQRTHGDIEALTARLNAINQPSSIETKPAATRIEKQAMVRVRPQTMRVRRQAHRADDPRWKKVQSQLDEQGRLIESTRGDLVNAKTELSGSIARTHDELVLLQKKGERNYYEFDIAKSDQFQRSGPMGVRLRKANVKHQYADLQLMVDDVDLTKKHVNLFEPVMFYAGDGGQPAELVINSITKNHIRGYISEPKYRRSELAAMSASTPQQGAEATSGTVSQSNTTSTAPVASSRQKLPAPQ